MKECKNCESLYPEYYKRCPKCLEEDNFKIIRVRHKEISAQKIEKVTPLVVTSQLSKAESLH